MEKTFDSGWGSNSKLNSFFFHYEKDVLSDYLLSLNNQNKAGIQGLVERNNSSIMDSSKAGSDGNLEAGTYMLFENKQKLHLKDELNNLPKIMENPYEILKRFIKWEIMDLEAMIDTIECKGIMETRKNTTVVSRTKHSLELLKLQKGNTIKSTFQSKQAKINRITDLAITIEHEEKEIDCAECLTKILFLYLHDAAIPFFRLDKLGVYNGAINLYA